MATECRLVQFSSRRYSVFLLRCNQTNYLSVDRQCFETPQLYVIHKMYGFQQIWYAAANVLRVAMSCNSLNTKVIKNINCHRLNEITFEGSLKLDTKGRN